ncbi:MAG: riboflavin biosynthesis protein RibD [Bacillaceae bacterium G1]|nr:bifunctional diaminohydroxyphosphoribosylaminopyrimidine deaminase/5-amino-6-(5-phosphoribosylamino)uracil reductase RibD [Bacillota bacterium]OJF18395.1 MAG: riboflavin biosynthesis protein RibD [Bacillaceae bacterium G1]
MVVQVGDVRWMNMALELARAALGQTSPNPAVGAVVVRNGEVVGLGAHLRAGEPHAEVHALRMAGEKAAGATLYVTLEPCNHYGKTPPCTEQIIAAGIRKVVIACTDPNPRVHGSGIARLKQAGLEVVVGVCEAEARHLNRYFFKWTTTGRPFVTVKTAATLDGKLAAYTGDSRWVTGEEARRRVHRLRRQHDAVMVGINTVLQDDPQLTVRWEEAKGRPPIRVVLDSRLRLPLDCRLVRNQEAPTLVYTTDPVSPEKEAALRRHGVEVVVVPAASHKPAASTTPAGDGEQPLHRSDGSASADPAGRRVDVAAVMDDLGRRGVTSVLVEGGGTLNFSLLAQQLVDEVVAFIAPKLIGGATSPTPFDGPGFPRMADAIRLTDVRVEQVGEDVCIIGTPDYSGSRQ